MSHNLTAKKIWGNSLVDRIIPILGLKSETATTLNKPVGSRPVASLGLLNWNLSYEQSTKMFHNHLRAIEKRTIHIVASIQLNRSLVSVDVELDSRPCARQSSHRSVKDRVLVDNPAVVISLTAI